MVRVTFVGHDGAARTVTAATGISLMEAAKAEDVPGIDAVCGGNCYCGTCRVRVPAEWLGRLLAPQSFELELLAATADTDADPSDRLSCQIPLVEALDGLVVHTPQAQC